MSADQQYEFSQRLNYLCCLGSGEFHEQCVNEVWKEVTRLQQSEARALKAEAERDAIKAKVDTSLDGMPEAMNEIAKGLTNVHAFAARRIAQYAEELAAIRDEIRKGEG